jgi:septal ring factor EnvC (AmiA/AmiB activator)
MQVEANPIRKVVTLLQDMQKELEAEGKKEEDLYDKFMCYCEGNTDEMSKTADEAATKITELKSKLEAEKAEKSQLDQALIGHKKDREAAKVDLEKATGIREKEHADFVEDTGDSKSNLDSMNAAIAALEKGMGKAFLQSQEAAARVVKVAGASLAVDDYQRNLVISFLSGKQNQFGDYQSSSGEIVGILKAMKDEMDKDLNGAISDEEKAAAGFEELATAKKAEISAASSAIETKTKRSGQLAVSVVTTADDIEDTTKELDDLQAFLANLASQCATKKSEWAERCQVRAEEVAAISEAIKILNDDDALDLFKKTLSLEQTASSVGTRKFGFLQKRSSASVVSRARDMVAAMNKNGAPHKAQLELLEFSLKAKKVDFSKVLAMIDGMEAVLKQEQEDDNAQKAFCDKDITKSESEKKDTEEAIAASEAFIDETTAESAATADEIKALSQEIKDMDKAVAEATEQRKEEHTEFLVFQQQSNAALQLIEKAKNRLMKFYRPTMYKEAPVKELTEEEKIYAASGRSDMIATAEPDYIAGTTITAMFAEVRSHQNDDAAPPPPPETWGAYQKKDGKSNGVIGLMDMLLKELSGDLTSSENEEKTSQTDYERLMADSQATRAQNVASITDKEAAKADMDTAVEETKAKLDSQQASLADIKQYILQLHANCDFIVENYDLRKAARENELTSLANAKGVLSGADFS